MIFIALTDFFALKYRHAKRKFKSLKFKSLKFPTRHMPSLLFGVGAFNLFKYLFHSEYLVQRIITEEPQRRYAA